MNLKKNMDICRLCLQEGAEIILNSHEILDVLRNFFPYMNSCLKLFHLQFCDTCLQNIRVVSDLKKTLNKTNERITAAIEQSKSSQVDLLNLVQTSNAFKNISICRICLKVVNDPQLFLYENEFNLLRHDLVFSMFNYCKVKLDCDVSKKPVMCYQCWENLQICYSFKKNYLETDKNIRAYCNLFKISTKLITDQVLQEMAKYFFVHSDDIHAMQVMIKQEIMYDDMDQQRYSLRKRVKKEYKEFNETALNFQSFQKLPKTNIKEEFACTPTIKRYRHTFTTEEDEFLFKTYLKITNNNTTFGFPNWTQIRSEWKKNFAAELSVRSITSRVKRILATKFKNSIFLAPKQQRKRYQANEKNSKVVNVFAPVGACQESDSDDSFMDEVRPSSFTPAIKLEPLSDTDEIHIIEPKTEPLDLPPSESDTDNESLPIPLLERMDLPQMNFKIKDCYSLEVKKESINMLYPYGDAEPTDIGSPKNCMMIKACNEEILYKCTKCNFETRHQYSADHHQCYMNSMKHGFECKYCSFATSKYFLLKHHLSTNHNDQMEKCDSDEDLPILMPFTI